MKAGKTNKTPLNRLWLYRKKRGYSQREVALLLGHKSMAHISEYERGLKTPSLKTALKLAVILSTAVDFIFSDWRKDFQSEIQTRREKLLAKKHEL